MSAKEIIRQLKLLSHPEGGYYKETYRCIETLTTTAGDVRNVSTVIYYLLENENKSRFHRIRSDEHWFFHQGQTLEIVYILNGKLQTIYLGNDFENNEVPQAVVPAGVWFAASIKNASGYALVSCVVAPGFDFCDFELAKQDELLTEYPQLKDTIEKYTS